MFRRLASFLFLAVFLSSCNLPVSMDTGGGDPPMEEALSRLEETYIAGTTSTPPLPAAASPTPSPLPTAMSQQVEASGAVASNVRYTVQPGTPLGVVNFLHPELGCSWLGVGGQAFQLNTEPAVGLVVIAGGTLEGKPLDQAAVSGGAPALGPGGFEIALGDHPVDSRGTVWIQLFDANGNAQSEKIPIDTYADCSRNLILLNFTEVSTFRTTHYLPLVGKERLFYYLPFVGKEQHYFYFPFVGQR